jgi:hypothetical protein
MGPDQQVGAGSAAAWGLESPESPEAASFTPSLCLYLTARARSSRRMAAWPWVPSAEEGGLEPQAGPTAGPGLGDRAARSQRTSPSPCFAGEYVVMISDVTTPPFLGRTLPTAFKHLRVLAKGPASCPDAPKSSEGSRRLPLS